MSALQTKKTVCMWCSNYCQVQAYVEDGRLVRIEEDKNSISADRLRSLVRACPRAREQPSGYTTQTDSIIL